MDLDTGVLLGVVGAMALNQLIMRVGALTGRAWIFWSLQVMNLAVGSAVIFFGLPGFEPWPVISWMLGLLFFYRTVSNTNARAEWLRERAMPSEEEVRRASFAAALDSARREDADKP